MRLQQCHMKSRHACTNSQTHQGNTSNHVLVCGNCYTHKQQIAFAKAHDLDIRAMVIAEWPLPKDAHQLRSCLGLATYFRKYVQGFARLVGPLTDLLKEKAP